MKRLLLYRRFIKCEIGGVDSIRIPGELYVDLRSVDPVGMLFLWGFSLESNKIGDLFYAKVFKILRVGEAMEVARWMRIEDLIATVPSPTHGEIFGCDLDGEVVREVWGPVIDDLTALDIIERSLVMANPLANYITSYDQLLSILKQLTEESTADYVFAISKFASPGYLGRFLEAISSKTASIYIALENPSKTVIEKISSYNNVRYIPTRSHRKLLLVLYRKKGRWFAVGFKGSMNVFYPGVDDYLEAVETLGGLRNLLHGIVRAFLLI